MVLSAELLLKFESRVCDVFLITIETTVGQDDKKKKVQNREMGDEEAKRRRREEKEKLGAWCCTLVGTGGGRSSAWRWFLEAGAMLSLVGGSPPSLLQPRWMA